MSPEEVSAWVAAAGALVGLLFKLERWYKARKAREACDRKHVDSLRAPDDNDPP